MKLEVGMYVRTKYNGISKIVDYINDPTHYFFKCYKLDRDYINCEEYITETDVLKTSHNIIDLIEAGDYVNGYPVYEKIDYPDNTRAIVIADDNKSIIWKESSQYIKSIVTKEQFESMKYEVE